MIITFKKNGGTKLVSSENLDFIKLIRKHGWEAETEIGEKEVKNGKSSKHGNKSNSAVDAE